MDSITLSTKDKTYTLQPLGTNALCELETRWSKDFGTLMREIGAFGMEHMRLQTVRLFLQECLVETATEEDIGALIDALGFDGISSAVNGLIYPAREIAA